MLIIGFGNKARHGKDSAANAVLDFYEARNAIFEDISGRRKGFSNTPIVKVGVFKFAAALYEEVNEFLKLCKDSNCSWQSMWVDAGPNQVAIIPAWVQPSPEYEPTELAPYGKHPKLLQWWGTNFRRAQDSDYWVKKLFASIPTDIDIALISDVRFPNEAEGITNRGGYNVNVIRLNEDGTVYFASDRPSNHESEIALDGYNWQFRLINHANHQALLGEQSITLVEYLRGLK